MAGNDHVPTSASWPRVRIWRYANGGRDEQTLEAVEPIPPGAMVAIGEDGRARIARIDEPDPVGFAVLTAP